jgi:hypothetical protein
VLRRWRRWALIVWTGTVLSTGVVARLSFAAPQPASCDPNTDAFCFDFHFEGLWYFLIALVWLLGLAVILLVGHVLTRRRRRPTSPSVGPQRRWLRGAVIGGSIGCIALPFGVWALTAEGSHSGGSRHANAVPAGVLVCRDPIQGPEALGGWQCPGNTDIGRAPVEGPQSLMCVSDLDDVKNATIGIQIVYDGREVCTRHLHSSDSSTEAYVARPGIHREARRRYSAGASRAAARRPVNLIHPPFALRSGFCRQGCAPITLCSLG